MNSEQGPEKHLMRSDEAEAYAKANNLEDGQTLGCWCHPKACHGDVLKRLREEQLNGT